VKTKAAVSVKKPKLTKRQMVVEVAKDVLKLLDRKQLKPTQGTYLSVPDKIRRMEFTATSLQRAIPTIGKSCKVCALGALVLCKIHKFDGVSELPFGAMKDHAYKLVGMDQAYTIESYFENWMCDPAIGKVPLSDRLRTIMTNIVANKGIFRPKQIGE
jgi:hypothetical protein